MLSLDWEQIAVKHRYCSFIFKCLVFLNSWQVHQQSTCGTVRVVSKMQSKVSGLTNNYCISISMQKVSSIHQFILEIQHKWFAHFWPCPPKTFESNFYLSRICINILKIYIPHSPSICSLDIANVGVPCPGYSDPLDNAHPKVFQSTFNFYKFKI